MRPSLFPHAGADPCAAWPWERLHSSCLREALRVLGRREEAEDVAQEALLRAWRQRDQCQAWAAPEAWVAQIARREALRALSNRRLLDRRVVSDPEVIHRVADVRSEHESATGALHFRQALVDLSPGDRALAILHYEGDVGQARLAHALGVPEATVRVRLHRVRKRLRETLREGNEGHHRHRRSPRGQSARSSPARTHSGDPRASDGQPQ